MSDWIFPDGEFALPQRWGGEDGKAQERAMSSSVGGNSGIRQASWLNSDGTWTDFHSRGGFPLFEKEDPVRTASVRVLRGFVARCSSLTVLFDPYTLEILQSPYVPSGALYEVQPFATTWNVPSTDDTHWCDVVLFDGSTIKVNALAMPSLGITASGSDGCIPHVRNIGDRYDQYGNQERNLTEKRVFAVGREHVQSWGGDGVTETLTPTAPRSENKAMTVGPRVASHTAYLGQLFYSGDSWDDFGGEWGFSTAQIAMLLTPPYLSKTSGGDVAAMTPPELVNVGPSSGSMTTGVTLPSTAIGMYATPALGHYANYPDVPHGIVYFTWAGVVAKEMAGTVHANYSRITLTGTANHNFLGIGTYSASNTKTIDSRSEYPSVDAQYINFTDNVPTSTDMRLNAASDHLFWSLEDNGLTIDLGPMRGQLGNYCEGEDVGSRPIVSRNYETQNGSFVMSFSGIETVRVTMFREYSTGEQWNAIPNMDFYNPMLGLGGAADYGDVNGYGIYNWPYVEPYYDGNVNPVSQYKLVAGIQSPEVKAEITNALNSMVTALMGQTVYQSENAEGYYSRPAPWAQGHYLSSITEDQDNLVETLTWDTKDYLFQDDTNEVYILVEGHFSGSGTSASLVVTLKVQTRYHTVTQTLYEQGYTYTELLPEKLIDPMAGDVPLNRRIPSPQIRAMYAPLYREQGSFKGAHYVTAAEEENGALPAHLFNFVLSLQMYGGFSTCNDDNQGEQVFFVPCNLLEMLYAFVFSQEYGVSQYERYPVTFPTRYDDLAENLFKTYRVCIRDGVSGHWIDTLGADFAARATTSLHRT
jgi:hypothetical protein